MTCRVRAIIRDGDRLLLVQHKDEQGQPFSSWALPGGKIDDGESLTDALQREMIEETGVAPRIGTLLYVHQFIRDGVYEGPEFFFEVTNAADYAAIDLTQTTHGDTEIATIGFLDPRTFNLRPEFLQNIDNLATSTQLVIEKLAS